MFSIAMEDSPPGDEVSRSDLVIFDYIENMVLLLGVRRNKLPRSHDGCFRPKGVISRFSDLGANRPETSALPLAHRLVLGQADSVAP